MKSNNIISNFSYKLFTFYSHKILRKIKKNHVYLSPQTLIKEHCMRSEFQYHSWAVAV